MPGHFGLSNQSAGRTASTENGGSLPTTYSSWVSNAFFPSYATIHTATNAFKLVLSDVGCTQPMIDDHDARVIRETIDGTYTYTGTGPYGGSPGLPNSQDDVGGWENYLVEQRFTGWDSDHDGLPDWWELAKNLNPNSAAGDFSDSNGDPDGDGYTNLEDYLNWLAAIHVDGTRGTNVDIDLTQFARGFTNNSPTYALSNPTNGTITALSGGKIARFTPTANFYGLGSFQFKVTDTTSGLTMTNVGGVHVRALSASSLAMTNSSGIPQLRFTGETGLYYLIQTSDDLQNWTTWTNATAAASVKIFSVPGFPNPSARFYRAVSIQ